MIVEGINLMLLCAAFEFLAFFHKSMTYIKTRMTLGLRNFLIASSSAFNDVPTPK